MRGVICDARLLLAACAALFFFFFNFVMHDSFSLHARRGSLWVCASLGQGSGERRGTLGLLAACKKKNIFIIAVIIIIILSVVLVIVPELVTSRVVSYRARTFELIQNC